MRANCWNSTVDFGDVDDGFPKIADVLICRCHGDGQA